MFAKRLFLILFLISTPLFAQDKPFAKRELQTITDGEIARLSVEASFYDDFSIKVGDKFIKADKLNAQWRENGSYDITFRVEGAKYESVATFHKGALAAFFYDEHDHLMEIRPGKDGYEIVAGNRGDCDVMIPEHTDAQKAQAVAMAAEAKRHRLVSRIPPPPQKEWVELMFVYTKLAVDGAGGMANMEALALNAVAYANLALKNSGYPLMEVSAVYQMVVDYPESTNKQDALTWVTNDPTVRSARDKWGADAVIFWVEKFGGIAWLDWSFSGNNAFAVVGRQVSLVLAHEWGHIVGMQHNAEDLDWDNPSQDLYPWAHGRYSLKGLWISVMSYDRCSLVNGGGICTYIPYFTSMKPESRYNGEQTGIQGVADNGSMLEMSFPKVANYRPSQALRIP